MLFKIIYIDDEPDLLEIFKDLFSGPGIQIATFNDINEAQVAVKASPPNLLFIDYRLKGLTGEEAALMFDKSIPKAMITGELNLTFDQQLFDGVFYKPYNVKVVEEFILRQRQSRSISN